MGDDRNCPFYGVYAMLERDGTRLPMVTDLALMRGHGAQCGLMLGDRADCMPERYGNAVDWRTCTVVDNHVHDIARR